MYQGKLEIKLIGFSEQQVRLLGSTQSIGSLTTVIEPLSASDLTNMKASLEGADCVIVSIPDDTALKTLDSVLKNVKVVEKKDIPELHHLDMSTEVIIAAPTQVIDDLGNRLDHIFDIWTSPLSDTALKFHFERYLEHRKRIADAWQTEQFFEATINTTPSLIWYKTENGIHEKVNDSFCKTVGKTKDQVQGQGHAYIWDVEEDDPACIESEAKVMSDEKTYVSEESVQTGEGEPRLLTTYKSPLYNIDGTVMGTVGLAIDITQERAYEESLLQHNSTLQNIFTSLECGILTHSVDGKRVVSVNQAALDILGYESEEDLVAAGFDMVAQSVLEEDKQVLRDAMESLNNVGDSVSTEYRVLRDNGEIIYVIGNVMLIEQNGEKLYRRFLLDYSDKAKEQNEGEARRRDQINALSEENTAVYAFDMDTGHGEVLRRSGRHVNLLDEALSETLNFDDLMNAYINKVISETDRDRMRNAFMRSTIVEQLDKHSRIVLNYLVDQDGEDVHYQATIVPSGTWGEDGNHSMVMGFQNVDEETRKALERKEMLEDALVRATRASEAKSAFLSNMSHDIRTPLNAIVGFTSLATNHINEMDRVQEYLEKIDSSSKHLLDLVNDVLDMSRIESGKAELDEEPTKLIDIITSIVNIVQASIDAKQLKLVVETDRLSDTKIMCDKVKIMQIFMNIIGNAIKFTDPGGEILIKAEELSNYSNEINRYRVRISDTGIGMDQEFLDHLFDPFERERTSTISGIQGTGLGMTIAKSLVEMMDGSITVESEKGSGTTFTIMLSFNIADDDEDEAAKPDSHTTEDASAGKRKEELRLFLVEDNLFNQEIAMTLLEDAGFAVECASDGQEAVEHLQTVSPGHYDAILMDIQMPRMNGYEATRAIRELEKPGVSDLPILAVTADAFESDREKALQSGMNGHLSKPIEIDKLFEALETLID